MIIMIGCVRNAGKGIISNAVPDPAVALNAEITTKPAKKKRKKKEQRPHHFMWIVLGVGRDIPPEGLLCIVGIVDPSCLREGQMVCLS